MELNTVLDPAIMDPAVEGTTKEQVLRRLAQLLLENGYIDDVPRFMADIYRREADGPTGMGRGVSIPHGKSQAARRLGIAVGRTAEPVPWESCVTDDGWQETRLVFLFCVQDGADFAENHMELLSQLARRLRSEKRLALLEGCGTAQALAQALEDEEAPPP